MQDLISRFRDYQIEWLTSHNDIEFCEEEKLIIGFLKDTAESFMRENQSAQQWIPCAERLPEDEDVLVWYEYFRYGDYNRMYQTYGIGYCSIVDSKVIWGGDVIGHGARAIAWMPLPEPYKEENEE